MQSCICIPRCKFEDLKYFKKFNREKKDEDPTNDWLFYDNRLTKECIEIKSS